MKNKLTFTNYRRISRAEDLIEGLEYEQARYLFTDMEEFTDYFIEAVDVEDGKGKVIYQAYFGGCGGMLVYRRGTLELAATAAQHQRDQGELELWEALGQAYAEAEPEIKEHIVFFKK